MLIGIDASRANRDHRSGTEWYSYYLIRWLAKLDSRNQYILYTDKPLMDGLLNLTTKQHVYNSNTTEDVIEFDNEGYQILKSPYNNFKAKILRWPFNFLWTQGRLSLEMIFKKVDVLFVPSHTLPTIHPKKSVITIHDIGFERDRRLYGHEQMGPEDKIGKKIINFFVKLFTIGKYGANSVDYHSWSTKYALKMALKVITVSHFTKKELIEVYGATDREKQALANKIKVIHNGYNRFLYKKIDEKDKAQEVFKKYDIEEPYILYIGKLEKKKNTPALIEAFAIMRGKNKDIKHKLVLVGDASYGYDEVKYMISEYLLDDEVIMPGWIEETDMPYIYSGATAFIFPSLYEGFGIPVIQAMACEVPVAASNTASIPEVVGDAALLFDPHDVNSIAQAMAEVITDNELRKKLIKRGKKRVKNFSWEECAKETLKEIENF
jgi:glycosyltransferase involved in cell wall biosynthesis